MPPSAQHKPGRSRRNGAAPDDALPQGHPRVRRATRADVDVLVRHRRALWAEGGVRDDTVLDEADRAYRTWVRGRMRTGRLVGFVSDSSLGWPVASGCVWLQGVPPRPGRLVAAEPFLISMYTEPAARGAGHARRIAQAALAWCGANGFPRFSLHAAPADRGAMRSLGFRRTWEMLHEGAAERTQAGANGAPRTRRAAAGRGRSKVRARGRR